MAITNFYSGPSILPPSVIQKAQEALTNFENTGLSILEISHRSDAFVTVMENARSLARELMGLDDTYEAIYMQGGASSQFYMVPQNFLSPHQTATYIDTGTWANGAMEQAKLFGMVHEAASSKKENYNHIPKALDLPNEAAYLHITSNNTIYGTQYHFPKGAKEFFGVNYPLIADMSSDILSRNFDYSAFDLIYAGAQKNIGTSGATLVVIKKEFLEKKQGWATCHGGLQSTSSAKIDEKHATRFFGLYQLPHATLDKSARQRKPLCSKRKKSKFALRHYRPKLALYRQCSE
jgi:phosphoserine aminotransferase